MSEGVLSQILGSAKIEKSVRQNLLNYLQQQDEENSKLKGEILKITADHEQRSYELDKKLIESRSQLDEEAIKNQKMSASFNALESQIIDFESKCGRLEMELEELKQSNHSLKEEKDIWSEEKLSVQHVIEKRDLEISKLNDEWKTVSDRLCEAMATKNDIQIKLDELSSSEVTSHYQSKRLLQEKELLEEQNIQMSKELKEKTAELLQTQKEKGNELVALRGRLELLVGDNKQMKEQICMLQNNETALKEKVTSLHEKLTKATEEYHSMESLHHSELQAQMRLAELYSSSAEDSEKKAADLLCAVEELQVLVKTATEKNDALEDENKQAKERYTEQLTTIEQLKKEVESANDLIENAKSKRLSDEQLREMCPSAAMASKFIKSGMTLTQIYTLLVETSDQLDVKKEENRRLNEAMDSILEELNAKAPQLRRQREDYDRALVTITQLTTQADSATQQFQRLRQETDNAVRRSKYLERENERYSQEASDLSKQVRFLIKEVEELRGRRVSMSPRRRGGSVLPLTVNDDGSCNDVSSSAEVISQHLVTFKDIGDLQDQNKRLLQVVRELSNEHERDEAERADAKSKQLADDLEEAREELERMREDRARQISLVDGIVRQRDTYRVLLAQGIGGAAKTVIPPSLLASPTRLLHEVDNGSFQLANASADGSTLQSPLKITSASDVDTAKQKLKQMQQEFDAFKRDTSENKKVMEAQLTETKTLLSSQRSESAKLDAQLGFANENNDLLKRNAESMKKEADALRERNSKLYQIISQHEHTVQSQTVELGAVQELGARLQAQIDRCKAELEMSKRAEDRLQADNSSLQREQRNQSVLFNNLHEMQQSMEKQAFEVRSQLHGRLEAQDREIRELRQNAHAASLSKQDAVQGAEKQMFALQKMLDSEKARGESLRGELNQLRRECDASEREKSQLQEKLKSLEDRFQRAGVDQKMMTSDCDDVSELERTRRELQEKVDELNNMEQRLEKQKRVSDHYKDVSNAADLNLKQANTANQELVDSLQARFISTSESMTKLEQQVARLEQENDSLRNDKYKNTDEVERRTADLRKQLSSIQPELEAATRRMQDAIKNEQTARDNLAAQAHKADEADDKYQREMLLHAGAVKELMALKEKSRKVFEEQDALRTKARSLEQVLEEKEMGWKRMESQLRKENGQREVKLKEVEEQNELLHGNIQSLSKQLLDVQSRVPGSTPTRSAYLSPKATFSGVISQHHVAMAAADSSAAGDSNLVNTSGNLSSQQQLLDVIKYLRREKEIAERKCELVQAESSRVKLQLTQSDKLVKQTQQMVTDEQAKLERQGNELCKLKSLEREVQALKSNQQQSEVMRDERDQLSAELRAANNRLSTLEGELTPLHTRNREMSAHNVALQSERKALNEEVVRWKTRVEQMTHSPMRRDPEEYRKIMTEKNLLTQKVEAVGRELAEQKSECSALKGQVRQLDMQLQSMKPARDALQRQVESKDEELVKARSDVDEKSSTINKIRKVGRKFKVQCEELQAKLRKIEEEKKAEEQKALEGGTESDVASAQVKEAQEAAAKLMEEKGRLQAELSKMSDTVRTLQLKVEEMQQQATNDSDSQSELMGENMALRTRAEETNRKLDENKKQLDEMNEKEKKFSKLLVAARSQIEKLRKDAEESRDRFQDEVKRNENERKAESERVGDLQNKVEELQRQLVERQAVIGGSKPIRPIMKPITPITGSTGSLSGSQRVNQVQPMKFQRTARVAPEQRGDESSQESAVDRPGPSASTSQVASSSTQVTVAVSVPAVASSISTALVHPMSPARQQQHVVSSGSQPAPASTQQPAPGQQQAAAGAAQQSHRAPSGESGGASSVGDSEQAIVSSSDDQAVHDDSQLQVRPSSSTANNTTSSSSEASEASSSSSVTAMTSSAQQQSVPSSSATSTSGQQATFHQISPADPRVQLDRLRERSARGDAASNKTQKRTRDEMDEQTSPARAAQVTASSSQIEKNSAAPSSKRQRGIPDQSSASSSLATSCGAEQPEVSRVGSECGTERPDQSQASSHGQPDQSGASRQPDQSQQLDENDPQATVAGSSDQDYAELEYEAGARGEEFDVEEQEQAVFGDVDAMISAQRATSSRDPDPVDDAEKDVIVLSSDSDDDERGVEEEGVSDDGEESDDVIADEAMEASTGPTVQTLRLAPSTSQPRNSLVIHPDPPVVPRQRLPSRPGPLTPGIGVQSSTDDGDGIVPCTPTLVPSHRHDDGYYAINSPRVPATQQPQIRFRFEDVSTTPPNFAAVPADAQNFNTTSLVETSTLMDFAVGGDEAATRAMTSSATSPSAESEAVACSDQQPTTSEQSPAAVSSSSIQEVEHQETDGLECGAAASSSQAQPATEQAPIEVREASSIPSNSILGRRRIRIIGAPRTRSTRGANSPSTSNQP